MVFVVVVVVVLTDSEPSALVVVFFFTSELVLSPFSVVVCDCVRVLVVDLGGVDPQPNENVDAARTTMKA